MVASRMVTHRTLRRDSHDWWQGWMWWLVLIAIVTAIGAYYLHFDRRQEEQLAANLRQIDHKILRS